MKFDIVFVTYNSEKWLDQCIKSVADSNYDLKDVTLIFYDNKSNDKTVELLKEYQNQYEDIFADFVIKKGKKNKGFGIGNNRAIRLGKSEYIFIYNVDTKMHKDTLKRLEQEINKSDPSVAMWELCQCPYEHPKYYDPVTQYTDWASGACMIVKRDAFRRIGGFDKNIFMYCEDVDLSFNFRRHGYKIKYLYDVQIDHYSYDKENLFKYNQFLYGFVGNWYVRAKYCSFKEFAKGMLDLCRVVTGKYIPQELDDATRLKLRHQARKILLFKAPKYFMINLFNRRNFYKFRPDIKRHDFSAQGVGAFTIIEPVKNKPLVSIIIRTCGRPEVLRETLAELRKQTYSNFEVVLVEDGEPLSQKMIEEEFSDLNIRYFFTEEKKGRSFVGNLGMQHAKGKYFNFLDDDDVFYPKHIETMVAFMEKNKSNIAYASAFEAKRKVISQNPYRYEITSVSTYNFPRFSRFNLYKCNFMPIQSVMFKRELYEKEGGFDTNIEYLEDWDLWVRYSLKYNFDFVDKTTSVFRVPAEKSHADKRTEHLNSTLKYLRDKFKTYTPEMTVRDFHNEENDVK